MPVVPAPVVGVDGGDERAERHLVGEGDVDVVPDADAGEVARLRPSLQPLPHVPVLGNLVCERAREVAAGVQPRLKLVRVLRHVGQPTGRGERYGSRLSPSRGEVDDALLLVVDGAGLHDVVPVHILPGRVAVGLHEVGQELRAELIDAGACVRDSALHVVERVVVDGGRPRRIVDPLLRFVVDRHAMPPVRSGCLLIPATP